MGNVKMNLDNIELKWQHHANHYKNLLRQLRQSEDESDVTLVCNDQVRFKAHKFILKSCSPVFESILNNNEFGVSRETIYFHGVSHLDMKAILDFLYEGKVSVDNRRLLGFKEVARNLKIKEIEELFREKKLNEKFPLTIQKAVTEVQNQSSTTTSMVDPSVQTNLVTKTRYIQKMKTPTLELVKHEYIEDTDDEKVKIRNDEQEEPQKKTTDEAKCGRCKQCKQ